MAWLFIILGTLSVVGLTMMFNWHIENERMLRLKSEPVINVDDWLKYPLDLSLSVGEEFIQPHVMQTILVESHDVGSYYRARDGVLQMLADIDVVTDVEWLDGLCGRLKMYSRVSTIDVNIIVDMIQTHLAWPIDSAQILDMLDKFNNPGE